MVQTKFLVNGTEALAVKLYLYDDIKVNEEINVFGVEHIVKSKTRRGTEVEFEIVNAEAERLKNIALR